MIKVGSLWLAIFIQPSCQSFCSGDASGDKTVEFKTQNSELGTWAMEFLFIWPVIAQLAVPVTVKLYATGMYMGTREIRERATKVISLIDIFWSFESTITRPSEFSSFYLKPQTKLCPNLVLSRGDFLK